MRSRPFKILFALCTLLVARSAIAQCVGGWLPGDGVPGTNGAIYATTLWDPDGPGPRTPVVVVAGSFTIVCNVIAQNIAMWDPATGLWSPLGTGIPSARVQCLAVMPDNTLVAGGNFATVAGVQARGVARWNGGAWSALGSGLSSGANPTVYALTLLPNGDLIAGGSFNNSNGTVLLNIARWNGASWFPLETGMGGGSFTSVRALLTLSDGNVIASGEFTTAGAAQALNIARWNGTSWSALGSGIVGSAPYPATCLAQLPSGDIVAGGTFSTAGGIPVNNIARWDGLAWHDLGPGVTGTLGPAASCLRVLSTGDLLVGGSFTTAGATAAACIARWNNGIWSALAGGLGPTFALTQLPDGGLLAGGQTGSTGDGVPATNIAQWNGLAWSALCPGSNGFSINSLAVAANGDVVAGGSLSVLGGVPVRGIGRRTGTSWSALGSGLAGTVNAVLARGQSEVIAAGQFTHAGGNPTVGIARWDGNQWTPLGTGLSATALALLSLPNGDIIAGGYFATAGGLTVNKVARWDGNAWSPLGAGIPGGTPTTPYFVQSLALLPSGEIIAAGTFPTAGTSTVNNIARWNGSDWLPLGSGIQGTLATLLVLPSGDLIAGGSFIQAGAVPANSIARWNGLAWSALGTGTNGPVRALATLADGDLLAAGGFTTAGGVSVPGFARLHGTTWLRWGAALGGTFTPSVNALSQLSNGEVLAGGAFQVAGSSVSVYLARWNDSVALSIAGQPLPAIVCPGGTAFFSVAPSGTPPFTYRWHRNAEELSESPGHLSGTTAPTLTITAATASNAGAYTCIVTGPACSATTNPANLSYCRADSDCSGRLDVQDVFDFLLAWFALDPRADFNGVNGLTSQDIFAFLAAWFTGC